MLHCCTWPQDWLEFLLKMIPHVPFSPTSHTLGIYVVRLIGPSELKIAPTFREPGKVRQIFGL